MGSLVKQAVISPFNAPLSAVCSICGFLYIENNILVATVLVVGRGIVRMLHGHDLCVGDVVSVVWDVPGPYTPYWDL